MLPCEQQSSTVSSTASMLCHCAQFDLLMLAWGYCCLDTRRWRCCQAAYTGRWQAATACLTLFQCTLCRCKPGVHKKV